MSIVNSQTYLNYSGSFVPERDINGNLISITSSDRPLNEIEQFFPVSQAHTASYTIDEVDSTFSELTISDDDFNVIVPPGAVLISESILIELEENVILLESQIITLQTNIESLNVLTGSLYLEIEQLYAYIENILGGGSTDVEIVTNQLLDGNLNVFYTDQLNAVGGIEPYSWTILNGALPPNITLNEETGQITGTPVIEYNDVITFQVTDFLGNFDTRTIGLKINPEPPPPGIVTITSPTVLRSAHRGEYYEYQLLATGGVEPYSWSYLLSLPSGLEMFSDGLIKGTPTKLESRLVEFKVEDSANPSNDATKDIRIKVIIGPP